MLPQEGEWDDCVKFLRDNPKLLMKMIPSEDNLSVRQK
jgi:hypothetical protein